MEAYKQLLNSVPHKNRLVLETCFNFVKRYESWQNGNDTCYNTIVNGVNKILPDYKRYFIHKMLTVLIENNIIRGVINPFGGIAYVTTIVDASNYFLYAGPGNPTRV